MGTTQRLGRPNQDGAPIVGSDEFLLPINHFKSALRRERLRSDRTLARFTLLTLDFGRKTKSADKLRAIVDATLRHRVRESDTAGWFGEQIVGIILPDTPLVGAWKLANDLHA